MLFDIGGTLLVEEGHDLRAGVDALLADAALPLRPGACAQTLARELGENVNRVHRTNRAEFRFSDWLAARLEPGARTDIAQLERRLWQRIARLSPAPGAAAALAALAERGVATGAVSNAIFTAETLAWELARHDLREPLAFVLSSADVGVRKPDPEIFRRALELLGEPAERVWFVGDSFEKDVAGAAAAGLAPIWVGPRRAAPDGTPHRAIAALTELPEVLAGARD